MTLERIGVPGSPIKRLTIVALVGGITWMFARGFSGLSMLVTGLLSACVVAVAWAHDRRA